MEHVMTGSPILPHTILEIDILGVRCDETLTIPEWASASLRSYPFVVARRGKAPIGMVPLGVRGSTRNLRWPGYCRVRDIREVYSPSDLLGRAVPAQCAHLPVFRSLDALKRAWAGTRLCWGPGGSVGFELCTGLSFVNAMSDLDLVVWAHSASARPELDFLASHASRIAAIAGAKIDIRIETPRCGFALSELLTSDVILARTPDGPVFTSDPWSIPGQTEMAI